MGLLARFVGMITSPRATFENVVAHPRWFWMLVLVTVIVAACVDAADDDRGRPAGGARQQGPADGELRDAGQRPDVREHGEGDAFRDLPRPSSACSSSARSSRVVVAGILFASSTRAMGGRPRSSSCSRSTSMRRSSRPLGQLFTGPLNYFRGAMSSATNLAVLLPMVDEQSFIGRLLGHDRPVHHLVARACSPSGLAVLYRRRTQPIAIGALRRLRGDRVVHRRRHERVWGIELTTEQEDSDRRRRRGWCSAASRTPISGSSGSRASRSTPRRSRSATSRRSCRRRARSSRSGSSTSAPTRWAASPTWPSTKATASSKDQFLLQIDPRNLRTRGHSGEASLAAARSQTASSCGWRSRARRRALKQAEDNLRRQQELWKGGLTTRETLERAENELEDAQAGPALAGAERPDAAAADGSRSSATLESARYDLSKVRIESPIDGIVTRRNIEEGETVVIGTMNNAGTVLLTIADMSVIEAEVEVDETDIPTRAARPDREDHDRRDARQDVHRQGDRDRQQPDSGDRHGGRAQATNFKVVRDARRARSRTCGPASPAPRKSRRRPATRRVAVPIQATTVREMIVDDKGQRRAGARRRDEAPPASSAAVQAAELKPGQARKELEGVFVVRDGKAQFDAGQDRHRRREVLRGAVRAEGRRQRHHRSVRSVRELARRRGRQGRAGRSAGRAASAHDAMNQFLEAAAIALQRDLGEQAAVVPDRARQHRRGHVDHRRGVAHPGDERLRHRRDRVGRRRRQLHDPARCRSCGPKPTRSASATTRASRSTDAAAVRGSATNIGAVAAQAATAPSVSYGNEIARQRAASRASRATTSTSPPSTPSTAG